MHLGPRTMAIVIVLASFTSAVGCSEDFCDAVEEKLDPYRRYTCKPGVSSPSGQCDKNGAPAAPLSAKERMEAIELLNRCSPPVAPDGGRFLSFHR
jgi:hypothetical protein